MKNLILLFLLAFTISVSAQSTNPKFSTTKYGDNTGKSLTYGVLAITPTSTMVTVKPNFNFYQIATVATTSISPTFTVSTTYSNKADQLDLLITSNATGTRTITFSTGFIANAATTQTLAASKQAFFRFVFDGSKYVEVARSVQP